jgi:hypothetical protein
MIYMRANKSDIKQGECVTAIIELRPKERI